MRRHDDVVEGKEVAVALEGRGLVREDVEACTVDLVGREGGEERGFVDLRVGCGDSVRSGRQEGGSAWWDRTVMRVRRSYVRARRGPC